MKLTKEDVVEYFEKVNPNIAFDMDILENVINSFQTPVTMDTIFNRHNDVVAGATTINSTNVILTSKSSISELPISRDTYNVCQLSFVFRIEDIYDAQLCNLSTMDFDSLAELTGAVVELGL